MNQSPVHPLKAAGRTIALSGLTLLLASANTLGARGISEPPTVFYGKILGLDEGQPFLVTEGNLVWILLGPDGVTRRYSTELRPLNQGQYSYRLNLPHHVLASGLVVPDESVPLTLADKEVSILSAQLNGLEIHPLDGNDLGISVSELRRASTHRVDWQVTMTPPDQDEDGIPDWWEDLHHLDKTDGSDGAKDLDGDGWLNLTEFRRSSDPQRDNRKPEILTQQLSILKNHLTGLDIQVLDSDSDPDELQFTLVDQSESIRLWMRHAVANPSQADRPLGIQAQFSQRNLLNGQIIVEWTQPDMNNGRLVLRVEDESPEHDVDEQEIQLDPKGFGDLGRRWEGVEGLPLDRFSNAVFWLGGDRKDSLDWSSPSARVAMSDYSSYQAQYGADVSQVFVGGLMGDRIRGGHEADWMIASPGNDLWNGGGGGDHYLFLSDAEGADIIEDFDVAGLDQLDFSRFLKGEGAQLGQYFQVAPVEGGSLIRVDRDGSGDTFSDLSILLKGVVVTLDELEGWRENGVLEMGDKAGFPRVSLVASVPEAFENGPKAGQFTLRRTGSLQGDLSVEIEIGGSAKNGTDYSRISEVQIIPSGVSTWPIVINPFADSLSEPTEVVEITIKPSSAYLSTSHSDAQVVIHDLQALVGIRTLVSQAIQTTGEPAVLSITRSGILEGNLVVSLLFGGTAKNGEDYDRLLPFVEFEPGQTSRLITIQPKSDSVLRGGGESVVVQIQPDSGYGLADVSRARVGIVEREWTFNGWRRLYFPDENGVLEEFASLDLGGKGISNLLRYAYGLDPENPDKGRLPRFAIKDGHFTLDIFRRPGLSDIEFVVETTSDLEHWDPSSSSIEQYYPAEMEDEMDVLCYRTLAPVHSAPAQFIRVRVKMKE